MTNENTVRAMQIRPDKGVFKGEEYNQDVSLVAGSEFENVILGMKQMLDKDLALKA